MGFQRTAVARPQTDVAEARVPFLRISRSGTFRVTAEALELLGAPEGAKLSLNALADGLAAGGPEFLTALTQLLKSGERFTIHLRAHTGAIVEARGAAIGIDAGVMFCDVTDLVNAALYAERRAEELATENANLRAAQRVLDAVVWRESPEGEIVWRGSCYEEAERRFGQAEVLEPEPERGDALDAEAPGWDLLPVDPALDPMGGLRVAVRTDRAAQTERKMDRLVFALSETFAHLNAGLMLFDQDRRLVLFNPAILSLLGLEPEALSNRPAAREVLERIRRSRIAPERANFAAWRDGILTLFDEPERGPIDEVWPLLSGQVLSASFRPHSMGGLAFMLEDVTESVTLRRSNNSEKALRTATTEILDEGIAVFGLDGRLRLTNAAFRRIWGLSEEAAAPGRHLTDLMSECDQTEGAKPFWEALKMTATNSAGRPARDDRILMKDGCWLTARILPMPDGSALAVLADITASENAAVALRERNEALEHAHEMRSALVDQISHQMRTPLNSVFGFAQLLGDARFGPLTDVQREYVDAILEGSRDLVDAVNGMSDLISIGGIAEDDPEPEINVGSVVREVLAIVERRFRSAPREVIFTLPEAPLLYYGRTVRLRQILYNLLMDAYMKSPGHSRIRLQLSTEGDDLILTCAHEMAENAGEGGLALSLIRRFARVHGGGVVDRFTGNGGREIEVRLNAPAAVVSALAQRG